MRGGYFAPKNSNPPRAGAFVPKTSKKTTKILNIIFFPEEDFMHHAPSHQSHPFAHANKVGVANPGDVSSGFRKLYDRGDFPICVKHDTQGNKINWKV